MTGTTSNIEGDFVLECAVGDTLTVSLCWLSGSVGFGKEW